MIAASGLQLQRWSDHRPVPWLALAAGSTSSIRLEVNAILRQQGGTQSIPIEVTLPAHIAKRLVDALLHAFQATDIDVGILVFQHLDDRIAALADKVLHVLFGAARHARESEVHIDELFRKPGQRSEVRQLFGSPRAEEQQQ